MVFPSSPNYPKIVLSKIFPIMVEDNIKVKKMANIDPAFDGHNFSNSET